MNPYVDLAKKTVETYVKEGQKLTTAQDLPQEMISQKAAVFVSLHQKDGSLRGCIGTFLPTQKNLAEEIISNAIAATQDPRFPPLTKEELANLVYSVDVLSEPRKAEKEEINPKKYGLLVIASDGRRGLLLPDLPGIETADQQITICKQKAGIQPDETVSYQIFRVKRYSQNHA